MAELTVRFDLTFGTRSLRCLMAAAMLFSVASEVASESVTLTTYYPAPSGVYTQMIVTGNTYLARDTATNNGKVAIGIGAINPLLDDLLSIAGNSGNISIGKNYPGWNGLWLNGLGAGTSASDQANYNLLSGQGAPDLFINRPAGYAIYFREGNVNQIFIAPGGSVGIGTVGPVAPLDVVAAGATGGYIHVAGNSAPGTLTQGAYLSWNGWSGGLGETDFINNKGGGGGGFAFLNNGFSTGLANQQMYIDPIAGSLTTTQGCAPTSIPNVAGVTSGLCPGQYVATVSGLYATQMTLPFSNYATSGDPGEGISADTGENTIDYLCCPCPASGCNL